MNFIYALLDPRTGDVRYVGKSCQPGKRLTSHCYTKSKTHVSHWVQRLRQRGFRPQMIILEQGLSEDQWPEREKHWIAHYKTIGAELTNITDGGHHVVTSHGADTLGRHKRFGEEFVLSYWRGEELVCNRYVKLTEEMKGWIKENTRRVKLFERGASMESIFREEKFNELKHGGKVK